MFEIIDSEFISPHLTELRDLLSKEWTEFAPFEKLDNGQLVPAPLLVIESNRLIGGLAFSRYKHPNDERLGLWVNAVLILPAYRGNGLASQLIAKASESAKQLNESQLFAYTEVPELYIKQGWEIIKTDGNNNVMQKTIDSSR